MMQSASQGEGQLSMQQSGKRVDRATLLLSLGAVVTFTGASLTLGQNSPPAPSTDASRLRLPATCLQQRRASEKIVTLLGIVAEHLTAGAYNTLGVLYAQADRAQCAVAAFENALKREDQNWVLQDALKQAPADQAEAIEIAFGTALVSEGGIDKGLA